MKKWVKIPLVILCSLILIVTCYYCINYGTASVSNQIPQNYNEVNTLIETAKSAITNNSSTKLDLSNDSNQTIYNSGIYEISGTNLNASININTNGSVILLLNNTNLSNSLQSVIYVEEASSVLIYTLENTNNTITSGEEKDLIVPEEDQNGAAIFSKDNLFFAGDGFLNVNGYINNAISSNDNLYILSGTYNINAVNNGIKAHDYLEIYGGSINVVSGNDGIKAINDKDQTLGIVNIYGGTIDIAPLGDGISAVSSLLIEDGTINITSINYTESISSIENEFMGGWMNKDFFSNPPSKPSGDFEDFITQNPPNNTDSNIETEIPTGNNESNTEEFTNEQNLSEGNNLQGNLSGFNQSDDSSNKGLKSSNNLVINGGIITITTKDDAIHCNDSVIINDGKLNIACDDDGIHADGVVTINNGTITITNSYEGIEGNKIYVNGGEIDLYAVDDGFNASGESNCILEINGGNILVNASGDGLDSNGDLIINGGYTIVNGPTNSGNGPLDSGSENGGKLLVNGGEILAIGASGMDEGFDSSSKQSSIHLQTDSSFDTGSTVSISDDQGNVLFTYTTIKSNTSSIVYSSESLTNGTTYTIDVNNNTYLLTMENNVASNATGGMRPGGMGGSRKQRGNINGQ